MAQEREKREGAPWEALHLEARRRFGVERLRPGQREVLEAVFAGRDAVALMPTGAGKSLCYQLPSLFLPKAVVVVSPLLALMEDQKDKAEDANIAVEKIDSTLTAGEQAKATEQVGDGAARLIYVTPERLEKPDFLSTLREGGVSLLAVDEAHCISQWGHDFRPAYMGLLDARKQLGNPPVLALTATATENVAREIVQQLGIRDPVVVNTGTERTNLVFQVHHTVNDEAKRKRIAELLSEETGSGIVYTASVKSATELYEWLKDNGVSVGCYHGKLRTREREKMQRAFMADEYKILVATKAFGMGVDKPDIRFVYHYEFPDSLESYYQEAGRAGRDGQPARAVLLFRLEDKRIQRFFMLGRYPRLEEMRAVLGALEQPGNTEAIAERAGVGRRRVEAVLHILRAAGLVRRGTGGYTRVGDGLADEDLERLVEEFKQRGLEDRKRLNEMMHYAESPECRKRLMRTYFSENPGEPCGQCDNCLGGWQLREEDLPRSARADHAAEVETAMGTIVTTAPETLPTHEEPPFNKGDAVRHTKFGPGRVVQIDGNKVEVRFDGGVKQIRADYLEAS